MLSAIKQKQEKEAEYEKGYEDGIVAERDGIIDAYYDGYRRGFRDSRTERNGYSWYNGFMMGALVPFVCGALLLMTGARHSHDVPSKSR